MGLLIGGAMLASKTKKKSTSTPATGAAPATDTGDIHLHTADELLAAHRAKQGFGPGPTTPAAETPSTGPANPPGGMVIPPAATPGVEIGGDVDDSPLARRRLRNGASLA